ncbi:MAG: CusA/CzcA family heavy metal efflux RND transporter [Candidatus Hydrogenedentota bacterium]|nr:MAG: CusA/CzcA family heavy metal efflux RND transporter [Candidatus Hydrogenedentota bacterium]
MEKLIDFSLKNRLLMAMFALMVMAAGIYGYRQLPVDAFPDVSPNLVQIFTVTDGLAPEEIEKFVTYPVEASMNGLPGVVNIRSVSNFGLSVVNVYFEEGMDIYFSRQLVGERLQEAREQIPDGFGEPGMGPISTGMGLILFYYLEDETGQYSAEELRGMQDWLVKFNLQTVTGVTEVLGIGGYEKQYHVVVKPDALLRYDVSISELIETVKANNLNVGAQYIEKNAEEYVVRSIGFATSIEDIEDIVVKSFDGTAVYIRDVAEVKIGGAIRRGVQTRNGTGEVVSGMVIKLFGTNSSTVITDVEDRLAEINKSLPEGVTIQPYYDQKTLVEACVKTVTDALVQGIILVTIVLFVFMGGFRPSIVVALSIPFSVLFACIAMWYFEISANLMSLGGLAIAIGMMVDATVVVVENADRLLRESKEDESKIHTIRRACLEVGQPITFAIIIIIVVFLPLFTLQGVEGKTFRPLAYTVSLAMAGSLIYALAIAPMISSFLLSKPKKKNAKEFFVLRILIYLYKPLVELFVKARILAVLLVVVLLGIGMFIFPKLGSEFTPTLQEGTLVVRLTMAPSISLRQSTETTMVAERRLMSVPEVVQVVTRIGRGEVGAHADPVNSAEMYIVMKDRSEWTSATNQKDLEVVIREALGEIPGVVTNFTQPIKMAVDELLEGVRAELAIKLFGGDLDELKATADMIADVVREVEGAADVQVDQVSGTPQLVIKIRREAIARYGMNVQDVQQVISASIGGQTAGQIFEGIQRYDILVRFAPEYRDSIEAIRNILIKSPDGIQVPLSELASIDEIVGPRQITREKNQRFITIQCNVVGRDIGTFVEDAQAMIDAEVTLPTGYFVTWGGQFRLQQEANKRLAVVVPVTLLLVFVLLFSNFNSIKNSLLIILNIPLALVGGIVGLWLTGQNLSVPSSVGFIALFGIALENGMVLVTYMNQLVRDGMSVSKASIEGACLRVRPVLMTAVTTGLGLLPLLFSSGTGSEVQRPLATVVIGGLVTSTILTLLVIPAAYRWFSDIEVAQIDDSKEETS